MFQSKSLILFPNHDSAVVMMVVQPGENNIYDQLWIEQVLFQKFALLF